MGTFLIVHSLGILYYSLRIHPLTLVQWTVLLAVESYVLAAIIELSRRRFGREHAAGAASGPGESS